MGHDVFVSYHSDSSRAVADQVVRKMESSSVVCWYAPRNVQEKFALDIMDAIQECSIFVVLLNKAASESEFVLDEIAEAKESKRKIIVLQLTDEAVSKEARLYLKRYHWVKVGMNLDAAIDELVDRALLNLGRTKPAAQTEKPKGELLTLSYCGMQYVVNAETIKYKGGSVYAGEIRNGRRHGKGKYTWANGDVYEGDWVEGKKSGKGKLIWGPNSKWAGDVYEGDWIDNKRTGKGKLIWANGDVYEGDFVEPESHGKGKLTWANGDVYEGDWVEGKRSGKGKLTWGPNSKWAGDRYDGDFVDGKRTGYGTYTYANGKIVQGRFKDNKYLGK